MIKVFSVYLLTLAKSAKMSRDSKLHYSLLREETFGKYLWSYLNLEHRVSIFSDFCVRSSTLVGSADDEYQEYKYVSEINTFRRKLRKAGFPHQPEVLKFTTLVLVVIFSIGLRSCLAVGLMMRL